MVPSPFLASAPGAPIWGAGANDGVRFQSVVDSGIVSGVMGRAEECEVELGRDLFALFLGGSLVVVGVVSVNGLYLS